MKKSQSAALIIKEAETNEKKTSKRDIIVVDDKELLARTSERIPKNTKEVTFCCLNVWNEWASERIALPQNSADLFTQVPSGVWVCCEGNITFNIHLGDYQRYYSPRGILEYQPRSPLLQSKPPPAFQTVDN